MKYTVNAFKVNILWIKIIYHTFYNTFEDYKAGEENNNRELFEKYQYSTATNIQVYAFLDVPKKKSQRKRKMEEIYIAPVFQKCCSHAMKYDSVEIKQDQVYFLIAEYASRVARSRFDSLETVNPNVIGWKSIFFMTIVNDMTDLLYSLYAAYANDILVDKKENAYSEWLELMIELLEQTKSYATSREEAHRIVTGQPIKEGYILAPQVVGDMKNRDY